MDVTKIPTVSFFEVLKNSKQILKNPLNFHHKNFEKHGDVFQVQLGFGKKVIFTRDSGFAKHILQKQHKKYYKSDIQTKDLAKYVGEGLLTSNGDKWLKQRRLIQPAFHKKKLESIVNIINTVIKEELGSIEPNKVIDIRPLVGNLAFNVVGKSLFSYTDKEENISRLHQITEDVQEFLIKELRQPYMRWWFNLSGEVKKSLNYTKESRHILNSIIEERRNSDKKYDDLLDMLLESKYEDGQVMDNEQLIDEILILFLAGHETTSNALSFTLLLLALYPEIQGKIYADLSESSDESLSFSDQIEKHQYTKQCIEESMRMYPPAYFSDRVNIQDDTYNNINFPKGSTILISFYEIHRHLDFWKDPKNFNPDRFHTDQKKDNSEHYFPFGAGPRMCIGNNLAMYEMIQIVNELVRKYKISTPLDTIEVKPMVTLRPLKSEIKFTLR